LQYFIYKSIILNNLFGVDIMNEAVEIAKLRLFLKLVSTADVDYKQDNYGLEPLPDIDFNIRCGNTLVGFASESEFKKAVESIEPLFAPDIIKEFEDEFNVIAKAFKRFQDVQLIPNLGEESHTKAKSELQERLKNINDKLNEYLSSNYGISDRKSQKIKYEKWLETHQPFHWFSEFYEIMSNGGFDVIIGNPPYVEYTKITKSYTLENYETIKCGNLYAYCIERSYSLENLKGRFGMIIPLSALCTKRMESLNLYLQKEFGFWSSHFGWRPSTIFEGVNIPVSIVISSKSNKKIFSTEFNKWYTENRTNLIGSIRYVTIAGVSHSNYVTPKFNIDIKTILRKADETILCKNAMSPSKHILYYRNTGGLYWRIILNFEPFFEENGIKKSSSTLTKLYFNTSEELNIATVALNSNFFWMYYVAQSSFHHVNPPDIIQFPLDIGTINSMLKTKLLSYEKNLIGDFKSNSQIKIRDHKGGKVSKSQTFYLNKSKLIIDEIDKVLAQHYGFTEAELDFIINYDIKYRMGKELAAYVESKL